MDYNKIAQDILDNVGGKANVKQVTHCFTRLRFILKDESLAKKDVVEHLEGVISVVVSGGQFQVVCGAKVTKIYDATVAILGDAVAGGSVDEQVPDQKQPLGNLILQKITEIFTPLVPAIAAAGLIKGLLAAFAKVPGFDTTNSTYIIMNTASNVIFYFMPIFLAYTASKALKCSTVVAMMLGGFICHPTIDALVQDVATKSTIFGLPVIKMAFTVGESSKVFAYTESVIPILLGVIVLYFLEKFLKKVVPEILQLILVPGLSLIIMVPVMLTVVGPVGIYVGYIIQFLYNALYGFSPVLGGIIVGGLWGVCVIFGAHRALLPIGLNDVALTGTNTLMCFAGSANFSQAGAALGVMLKTKSQDLKQVAASASLSAWLVGITEPAIYGCNLRLKKPMVCAVIAGALGGGIMGIGHAVNTGFANNGILTIMSYYGEGTSLGQFVAYLLGIAVAFFGAAILTYIVGFEDVDAVPAGAAALESDLAMPTAPAHTGETVEIASPVEGKAYPLNEVQDEVFASEALGKGIAVLPTKGEVVAPADCTVSVLYPTLHAMGLKLEDGTELLIHIGMDTVAMNGDGFTKHVNEGDKIKKGTPIVSFDIDKIKAAGYDTTVSVIISNTADFAEVTGVPAEKADLTRVVIKAVK
ncbi:beta-glucoside-specific PTS transporter subunit IIABC [Laedolimicola intestinihominis]|uniref:Beta-glucoside-specific PTS transporter subunit IIABC n=1 Tax=Laedolimicola intestinihominis TaxID=3133166 RepID=A0ABV1FJW1_9FIRM